METLAEKTKKQVNKQINSSKWYPPGASILAIFWSSFLVSNLSSKQREFCKSKYQFKGRFPKISVGHWIQKATSEALALVVSVGREAALWQQQEQQQQPPQCIKNAFVMALEVLAADYPPQGVGGESHWGGERILLRNPWNRPLWETQRNGRWSVLRKDNMGRGQGRTEEFLWLWTRFCLKSVFKFTRTLTDHRNTRPRNGASSGKAVTPLVQNCTKVTKSC